MKNINWIQQKVAFLFSPEDTSTARKEAEFTIPAQQDDNAPNWLEMSKAILWLSIAILLPILLLPSS